MSVYLIPLVPSICSAHLPSVGQYPENAVNAEYCETCQFRMFLPGRMNTLIITSARTWLHTFPRLRWQEQFSPISFAVRYFQISHQRLVLRRLGLIANNNKRIPNANRTNPRTLKLCVFIITVSCPSCDHASQMPTIASIALKIVFISIFLDSLKY